MSVLQNLREIADAPAQVKVIAEDFSGRMERVTERASVIITFTFLVAIIAFGFSVIALQRTENR